MRGNMKFNSLTKTAKSCLMPAILGCVGFIAHSNMALADVDIKVNLSTQRMNVSVDGRHYATYKVSTGRRGYTTPTGRYRIQRMTRMHYSRKYNNSPMPNSIFYHGGYAIHGTGAIKRLGRVASHGCVRLHPKNARTLYNLVKSEGRRSTKIKVYRGPKTVFAEQKKKTKPFFIFGGLNQSNSMFR